VRRDWFARALRLLAGAGRLWESAAPAAIAGFAVGRDSAERALADQPPGAFLVRCAFLWGTLDDGAHIAPD